MSKKYASRKNKVKNNDTSARIDNLESQLGQLINVLQGSILKKNGAAAKAQAPVEKKAEKVDTGFRNLVIIDNESDEVVHTVRNIPQADADNMRKIFYHILVRKLEHDFKLSIETVYTNGSHEADEEQE